MKKSPASLPPSAALALLLAVLFASCQSLSPPAVRTDQDRLQGHWEGRGPGGPCSVTISGNVLRFQQRPDFWYETTFTLAPGTDPKQLYATIVRDSSTEQQHIGTVVVAIFEIEGERLSFGVIDDFEEPPESPPLGDWDTVIDQFHLERVGSLREEPAGPLAG